MITRAALEAQCEQLGLKLEMISVPKRIEFFHSMVLLHNAESGVLAIAEALTKPMQVSATVDMNSKLTGDLNTKSEVTTKEL